MRPSRCFARGDLLNACFGRTFAVPGWCWRAGVLAKPDLQETAPGRPQPVFNLILGSNSRRRRSGSQKRNSQPLEVLRSEQRRSVRGPVAWPPRSTRRRQITRSTFSTVSSNYGEEVQRTKTISFAAGGAAMRRAWIACQSGHANDGAARPRRREYPAPSPIQPTQSQRPLRPTGRRPPPQRGKARSKTNRKNSVRQAAGRNMKKTPFRKVQMTIGCVSTGAGGDGGARRTKNRDETALRRRLLAGPRALS